MLYEGINILRTADVDTVAEETFEGQEFEEKYLELESGDVIAVSDPVTVIYDLGVLACEMTYMSNIDGNLEADWSGTVLFQANMDRVFEPVYMEQGTMMSTLSNYTGVDIATIGKMDAVTFAGRLDALVPDVGLRAFNF